MRHTIATIALAALIGACGVGDQVDGPTTYYATADASGLASVRVESHTPGDVLSVEAWRQYNVCCNAVWVNIPDVAVQYDGVISVRVDPDVVVVFVVEVVR